MLAGLLQPSSGRALWLRPDADSAQAKGRMGFLSGSTGLYARLTPRETLSILAAFTVCLRLILAPPDFHSGGLVGLQDPRTVAAKPVERREQRVSLARACCTTAGSHP